MKRIFASGLSILLLSSVFSAKAGGFTASQMKRMGVFLSNFTELGYVNFKRKDIINGKDSGKMIHFGIWHNYLNNPRSTIKPCYQCQWGDMTIDAIHIRQTLKRYFNYDLTDFPEVEQTGYPYHFDGKRYHFSLVNKTGPRLYAQVTQAEQTADGNIAMTGYLYKPGNRHAVTGRFKALASPYFWHQKKTWTILNIQYPID